MTAKKAKPTRPAKEHETGGTTQRLPFKLNLTPREHDVMRLVARGMMDKEIADELGISSGTVHSRMHGAFIKLGVGTRTEAAIKWLGAKV